MLCSILMDVAHRSEKMKRIVVVLVLGCVLAGYGKVGQAATLYGMTGRDSKCNLAYCESDRRVRHANSRIKR
jgi:hypothetical protein